ncbi:MAG TPA: RNA polymerase sigma factor [Gaiellaceae bacterium]
MNATAIVDGACWDRVRQGEAEALGELFQHHAKAIYNFCFRRTADWAAAEDLTSVVFLEAWRRRDQELAADKVLPWLFGIANNVVRNRRRALRRHSAALSRLDESVTAPDFADDVVDRIDEEQRMAAVLALVARLPRGQQEVLALCDWAGQSYEEAAAALSIPIGTVRSRLARARTALRELEAVAGHGPGAERPIEEEGPK